MEVTLMLISVWKAFLTCFWFIAGDWKLVPTPIMILSNLQYSDIWPSLIVDIYHFLIAPYSLFQKSEKLESWHNWLLSRTCNLAPVKRLLKIIVLAYNIIWPSCSSKDLLKNASYLMYYESSWHHKFGKSLDG